jgi:hypothetical protein
LEAGVAYVEQGHERRRPRRTGRRVLIGFLVLFLIVAVLAVTADRVGASLAEDKIAERVSQEMTNRNVSSSPPDVTIGGFPFLTQVINEKFQSISIVLKDVAGEGVRVPRLDAEARNVVAPRSAVTGGQGDIVAETVNGTATVAYASVAQLTKQRDLKLSERGGRLVASVPVELLGQRFTLNGEADVSVVTGGKIRLKFSELTADGLPNAPGVRSLITGLARQLSIDFALPALPFALEVRDVKALPDGLQVSATAKDVPLNRAA